MPAILPPVVEFDEARRRELELIRLRRAGVNQDPDRPLLGVSLSGGGIRSATFNLGILQGMVESGILPCVDFLSTVSGGGYIGSWLHGVIRRVGNGQPAAIAGVMSHPDRTPHASEAADDPIYFLREYSSYLAPDIGLFSAEFWTILVIWIRNTFLNQLILAPFLACLSLLVLMAVAWSHVNARMGSGIYFAVEALVSLVLLSVAILRVGAGVGTRAATENCDDPHRPRVPPSDSTANAVTSSLALLAACLGFSLSSPGIGMLSFVPWWGLAAGVGVLLSAGFLLLQAKGRFPYCYRSRHHKPAPLGLLLLYAGVPGMVAGFLFYGIARMAADWNSASAIAWGTPLFAIAILTGNALNIGLMGIDYPDDSREWLARVGAFVSLFCFVWSAIFAIAIFGPVWITALAAAWYPAVAGLGGGWILTTVSGALSGQSARTSGSPNQKNGSPVMEFLSAIAPTAFVVGYLLIVSFAVHQGIIALCGLGSSGFWLNSLAAGESHLIAGDFPCDLQWALILFAIGGVLVAYLPNRININEFSLHHFYKNRLVRCYMGATHGRPRRPSGLTGFDPCDDIPLADFVPTEDKRYYGPYPIVNACLNLNRGSDLARAERKGTSFIFTPDYCGYEPPRSAEDDRQTAKSDRQIKLESCYVKKEAPLHAAFRRTRGYGYPNGPDIGTCMAISGAAMNPNEGYHTSAPTAFLMTMMNVRLGWWVGNTRLGGPSRKAGPRHALLALLSELFALTNSRSNFLNLSDGGHFENLGIYELAKRRCTYIITGDGEEDGNYTFESLGGAVRKCRTDFGIEIDIDPRRIHPGAGGLSGTHCVVGKIRYPATATEPEETGWLLYLKSSLTGDESEDVAQYKASHGDFPQQPTSNQFFTESQFESYRKLGLHVWRSAIQNVTPDPTRLDRLFDCLYAHWYPPTELAEGVATRETKAYSRLLNKLADPALIHLRDQVISPTGDPAHIDTAPAPWGEDANRVFLYTLELIQLMENVWGDLNLSEKGQRESPANQGWITVFRYWTHQRIFRDAWLRSSYTFNPSFRQFYGTLAGDAADSPCGPLP